MKTKTSEWFEVKFQYEKTLENGTEKKVTELYVVDAISFSEAETTIIEKMEPYVSTETFIKGISRAPYKQINFDERDSADKYYKAKLDFITFDERIGNEKKTTVTFLVQAASIDEAKKSITEMMKDTMSDYVIQAIAETKIMDVFEHE